MKALKLATALDIGANYQEINDAAAELRRLAEVNAELLGALEAMEKQFGYGVVHEGGMVHDEHEAIRRAMTAITKAKAQQ